MPETLNDWPVSRETHTLTIDLRPDVGSQTALLDRLAIAALPIERGRLRGRESVIFANQPSTEDGSIALTDTRDSVNVHLDFVPEYVERVSFVVFMQPKANAGKPTLDDFHALTVYLRDGDTGRQLDAGVEIAHRFGPVAAATALDVVRTPGTDSGWTVSWAGRGHEAGLTGALAQLGVRL